MLAVLPSYLPWVSRTGISKVIPALERCCNHCLYRLQTTYNFLLITGITDLIEAYSRLLIKYWCCYFLGFKSMTFPYNLNKNLIKGLFPVLSELDNVKRKKAQVLHLKNRGTCNLRIEFGVPKQAIHKGQSPKASQTRQHKNAIDRQASRPENVFPKQGHSRHHQPCHPEVAKCSLKGPRLSHLFVPLEQDVAFM